MIHASELRLGNWYNNGTDNYTLGTSAFMDYLNEAQVNEGIIDNIYQIPLTPDILKKCGFKYGTVKGIATIGDTYNSEDEEGDTEYWDLGKLTIVRWGQKEFILSHKSSFDHRIEIKSLHQLQNIHYAIAQTELKINL